MQSRSSSKLHSPKKQGHTIQQSEGFAHAQSYPRVHELNNKIAIILAHCELMGLQRSAHASESSKHLSVIRKAAQSIAEIVANRQFTSDRSVVHDLAALNTKETRG